MLRFDLKFWILLIQLFHHLNTKPNDLTWRTRWFIFHSQNTHSVTTIFHWPITARALGRWEKWFPWTVVILSPPEAHFCAIRVLAQWNGISVWNFWHTLNAATWFICNKKVCVITSLKREIIKFCMEAYSFPSCMVYTAQSSSTPENVYHLVSIALYMYP